MPRTTLIYEFVSVLLHIGYHTVGDNAARIQRFPGIREGANNNLDSGGAGPSARYIYSLLRVTGCGTRPAGNGKKRRRGGSQRPSADHLSWM